MGLFGKIKDILFEEEEVIETEKPEKVETKIKEEKYEQDIEKLPKTTPKIEKPEEIKTPAKEEFLGEREYLSRESSSPFLDFDEEEFSNILTKPTVKATNVLEYEKRKKTEKRTDYGHYERKEIKEVVEKRKFRPSPIISPVYGILNEDYRIEDIKNKNEVEDLDIETVRKKAFAAPKKEEPKVDFYEEETVTVKYEEPEEEKIKKDRTIDDLLEDTSDEIIDTRIDKNEDSSIEYDELEKELELDNEEEIPEKEESEKVNEDDDTIESDLFDLIDSMYENREDGE